MKLHALLVTMVFLLVVFGAGCTGTQSAQQRSTAGATTSSTAGANLVPGPTDAVPDYLAVTVDVGEKDYLGGIPVIFQGGTGQIHVKYGTVTVTTADGQKITEQLGNRKGDEVNIQGTKQTDRVEVWVTMDNGQTYKIIDKLSEYRTRG